MRLDTLDPNCSFPPHPSVLIRQVTTKNKKIYINSQLCVLVPGEMLQEICLQEQRALKNALKTASAFLAFPS